MITHAKIQKWGNSLALRLAGPIKDIPNLTQGMLVDIEITEDGFTVRKSQEKHTFPFTEAQLVQSLSPYAAHADELALLLETEIYDS
ncbi:hypothetical protein AwWohl_06730 [Gammaproteobacteria bacterium]|nr:hypothetical protein AwWohl_06730 [Gammaproteobacteria bacterium]